MRLKNANFRNGVVLIKCSYCYKHFEKYKSKLSNYGVLKKNNYCSKKCDNLHRKQFIGLKSKNWKGGKPNCFVCNKKLSIYDAKICSDCEIGKLHHCYKNGNSYIPYPIKFNTKLKKYIRSRDNYKCKSCGINENNHLINFGRVLSIHHIDHNKNNCRYNNLITLCNICNSKANFNISYWKNKFKYMVKK